MHNHSSVWAHRPRLGRTCMAVSQPAQCRIVGAQQTVSQRISTVSQAQRPYCGYVSRAMPRASHCIAAHKRSYPGRRAPCRGLASQPCRDTTACPALTPCHNTPRCIAIQFSTASFPAIQPKPFKQLQSRYNVCIVTQPASQPSLLSCNTMPTVTIQFQPSPRLN